MLGALLGREVACAKMRMLVRGRVCCCLGPREGSNDTSPSATHNRRSLSSSAPPSSPPTAPAPAMPTCRRKRVLLAEPSQAILEASKHDPNKQVFQVRQTGEIFESYEYAVATVARPRSLTQPVPASAPTPAEPMPHACHSTGSSSSNVRSPARVAWTTSRPSRASSRRHAPCTRGSQNRSSRPCSKPCSGVRAQLISIARSQPLTPLPRTEVVGRLDHLVEAVYDRFKDRYYPDESAHRSRSTSLRLTASVSRNICRRARRQVSGTCGHMSNLC